METLEDQLLRYAGTKQTESFTKIYDTSEKCFYTEI